MTEQKNTPEIEDEINNKLNDEQKRNAKKVIQDCHDF